MIKLRTLRILFVLALFWLQFAFSLSLKAENGMVNATQQPITKIVTGTIVDDQKIPLPGVAVVVKGTTIGTSTDGDGKYSIKVDDEKSVLVFSMIGLSSQEIAIKGKKVINVTMANDVKALKEVVVVGYGTLKKSDVATAITTIKPSEFNGGGSGGDALSLLSGKVAGLQVSQAAGNDPTKSSSIQLRGVTSLSGSRSPLIVIDGIPGGSLDLLQQDDIETFTVLKDGSAAAIYGSQANAGVILITTKRGKAGEKTRIEYSTYAQHYQLAKRADFMNASQYRAALNDPNNTHSQNLQDFGASTDWYDEMLNKSNLSTYNNLAISGGNENLSYRASGYYNDFNGIAKKNSNINYGARGTMNGSAFNNMITTQVNLVSDYRMQNLMGGTADWESLSAANPTMPIYNEDGTYQNSTSSWAISNPVARLAQEKNNYSLNTNLISGKISLEPIEGLKFNISGSVQHVNSMQNIYRDKDSKSSVGSYDGGGYARKEAHDDYKKTFEPTIDWTKSFGDHSINAVGGYSYLYSMTDMFSAANAGFISDAFQENNLGAGSWLTADDHNAEMSSHREEERLISFFGRVNYAYQGKYVIQGSIRHEGSSKFGDNHKWGDFPSVSGAWNISNEEFMKPYSYISNLKFRAGYGITGNSGIGNYNSITQLGTGGNYIYSSGKWDQTYGPSTNPNPDLKWETKNEFNIGVDFGLLKNKLSGTIDFYDRTTKDLLGSYTALLPAYINPTIFANVGEIKSTGIEVSLDYIAVSKKDWMWKTSMTASHTQNKITSLSNSLYSIDYRDFGDFGNTGGMSAPIRTYEGDRIGNYYGKKFAGFSESGDWLFYKKDGSKAPASDISDEDLRVIGNAVPKLYMSWSNYINYKNFDFTVSFAGRFGFQVVNETALLYGTPVRPTNVLNGTYQNYQGISSMQFSSYYVSNGDFVKLDNLTVGYTLQMSNPLVPKIRFYLTGKNLFYLTAYKGVNPEVQDTGLGDRNGNDYGLGMDSPGRYPVTRTFTAGLNVTF